MKLASVLLCELFAELHTALEGHLRAGRHAEATKLAITLARISRKHTVVANRMLGFEVVGPLVATPLLHTDN